MSNPAKLALAAVGAAIALVLFFVLRPDDESAVPTNSTPSDTAPTETSGEMTLPTTTQEPEGPEPVRITFEGGDVSGPRRPEFTVGDRVILVVRADVVDHVHVHGYDLMEDVAPGSPARFSFRADAPGRFEVELEERHLPLTELVVSP